MEAAFNLSNWLKQQRIATGANGFVCGLSGGIDSAVVAALCLLAAPDETLGVIMPCHSNPTDEADAVSLAEQFKLPTLRVPLDDTYDALTRSAETAFASQTELRPHATDDIKARVPAANVKPRLRMATLYLVANRLNYLVVGTGNRSEIAIGYYTKYGDGGVDLLPIGRLLKREVVALARELEIPVSIIEKAPTAGLWQGQTDESEMGFTYGDLDKFLTTGPASLPQATAERIQHLVDISAHKRALPPMPPQY